MITSNPYNLPDKILKPNQITKPITLQNKKSRDRSYEYSKQVSSKGIKIQTQMKKSLNLQHITSSPNLHTPSTSSSTNRPFESSNVPRQIEYHQTHMQSIPETQNDRIVKFLLEKFYLINEQLNNHDSVLNKLANDKDKDRNSWDSPFEMIGINQKETRERDEHFRHQAKNIIVNGQANANIPSNDNNSTLKQIEQIKKEVSLLKQQISYVKIINRQKQQQNNPINSGKNIKFNSNLEYQFHPLEKKFAQDFTKTNQNFQHLRISTHEKFVKIQNLFHKIDANNQLLSHKVNKAQEKIDNMESNIQNHIKLVNQEINNALTKIVNSINQKISKALQNNLVLVNQKLKKCIQACKTLSAQQKKIIPSLKPNNIEGKLVINSGTILKLSGYKAEGKALKIKMKSILAIVNEKSLQKSNFFVENSSKKGEYSPSKQSTDVEEIILDDQIYHIDTDGYLMDENKIYLIDQNNNLLQLESDKLAKLKQLGVIY